MTKNRKTAGYRRIPRPYPKRPTPREIRALRAVADGSSLSAAGEKLGITGPALGSILSGLYDRLEIKDLGEHRLGHDRRRMAVNICKREGWWKDES